MVPSIAENGATALLRDASFGGDYLRFHVGSQHTAERSDRPGRASNEQNWSLRLSHRQDEIEQALDLTKGQASFQLDAQCADQNEIQDEGAQTASVQNDGEDEP